MSMGRYRGVNGVARQVTDRYRGVSGVARKLINGYRGVSGVARQYWQVPSIYFHTYVQSAGEGITTMNDSFAGIEDGKWRLYVDATCTKSVDDGRAIAQVRLKNFDFGGKTLTMKYTASGHKTYADNGIFYYKADNLDNFYSYDLVSNTSSESTVTFTVPDDVVVLRIRSGYGASGTGELEFIISALTIGDYVFV